MRPVLRGLCRYEGLKDGTLSLELHIGVDNGVNISAVCRSIIKEVRYKVAKATGVPVKSVDVYVDTVIVD